MISRCTNRGWYSLLIAIIVLLILASVEGAEKAIKSALPPRSPARPRRGAFRTRRGRRSMVFRGQPSGRYRHRWPKYKIEIVSYHHKYVIAEGVATVNRLIYRDKVQHVSVLGGAVVKAIEDLINEGKVLSLPIAYAEGVVSPKNPLQFSTFATPPRPQPPGAG